MHGGYESLSIYREAHDGMLASNMESGLNEGYDRLDELLRTTH